ncbi:hypothetical protein G7070_11000 [Propioniciclava coleopterorum]|uniref:PH domain-containing protein n=1 Tax=Propioniciclava coleopterorum TaxID=2714937 RepID=A0A6G7Y7A9_9ACTN|nr:hypothetical protein [Propioniciclava coleopterorum]QIK72702.1 hypothetical protein G7070_11000 [Propioniciclava coleopterorum]
MSPLFAPRERGGTEVPGKLAAMDVLSYPVLMDPEPAVLRWRARRGRVISRVIGLVISVAIWAVIWWLNRENLWQGFWWILGISLGISVALLLWSAITAHLAKRDVKALHEGLALGLGRDGIYLDGPVPWDAIRAFLVKPGRLKGSATLVVVSKAGTWRTLPLQWLDQTPAAIDNAIRALSANRLRIDLAPIDRDVTVAHEWSVAAA